MSEMTNSIATETPTPPAPKRPRKTVAGGKPKPKKLKAKPLAKAKPRPKKPKTRTPAGKDGKLAAAGKHLLVVRVDQRTRKAAWKHCKAKGISMNAFVAGLIEKAAK